METALRVTIILAVALMALWVATYLHENPVERETERLRAEVDRLETANQQIRDDNEAYRRLVRGLREDPRVLDRRARETLGLSRTDELIILFEEPRPETAEARLPQ